MKLIAYFLRAGISDAQAFLKFAFQHGEVVSVGSNEKFLGDSRLLNAVWRNFVVVQEMLIVVFEDPDVSSLVVPV